MVKLSIIIPAYNEEKRILKTLEVYNEFFSKRYKNDFETLVILNGCRDNTLSIVKEAMKKYKQIRYKEYKEALGKGGAVIEGFKFANGDLIGFIDADLSTKPNAFNELIKNIGKNEGVIASRWVKGAKILKKQSIMRRIGSRGFNILVKTFFNLDLRDTQCGAKLFKKNAIKSIVNKLGITEWAWDIDLLYLMKRSKYKVTEIPTEWVDSEGSTFWKDLKKTIPQMFLSILRLRLIYSPFRFIVKVYDKIHDLFLKQNV